MKKNLLFILSLSLLHIPFISCSGDDEPVESFEERIIEEENSEEEPDTETESPQSTFQFDEPAVTGATYYLDPINGSMQGDGSETDPWGSFEEVWENGWIETYETSEKNSPDSAQRLVNEGAPIKGGDRLILKTGYHGDLEINAFAFEEWLTVEGAAGAKPVFSRFHLNGNFRKVYLKNFTILRESYQGAENYWAAAELQRNNRAMLYLGSNNFHGNGSRVKINGLTIKTTENPVSWSRADWEEKYGSGIYLRSVTDVEIVNSTLENVGFGIVAEFYSDRTTIADNRIENYCRDAMRVVANDIIIEHNTVIGTVDINTTSDSSQNFHYDGLQFYSRGADNTTGQGSLNNVTVRGNLFVTQGSLPSVGPVVNYTQGIGGFDGFFHNFIIENNVVITSMHHGISLYGATNTTIANNTVIDQDPDDNRVPWIGIYDHKTRGASSDCLIANNIVSHSIRINSNGDNITEHGNYAIGRENYDLIASVFTDPTGYDLHLSQNSIVNQEIIDAGTVLDDMLSSQIDRDGSARIGNPDLGAYERK